MNTTEPKSEYVGSLRKASQVNLESKGVEFDASGNVKFSKLHTWSRSPMHASVAKLSDSVKLLIELDEKWELSRFDIEAHASPAPSIEFRKPTEARDAIPGADWQHTVADDSHRLSAVCDGVYCWFSIPFAKEDEDEELKSRPAGTTECQKCDGRGLLAWPDEMVCTCCHGRGYFSHL